MNILSLTIYKKGEAVHTYEERDVRWGVIQDALILQEKMKTAAEKNEKIDQKEQIADIAEIVREVFPDLTDEHLKLAYISDIMNTFKQITAMGSGLFEAQEGKNAQAEKSK